MYMYTRARVKKFDCGLVAGSRLWLADGRVLTLGPCSTACPSGANVDDSVLVYKCHGEEEEKLALEEREKVVETFAEADLLFIKS